MEKISIIVPVYNVEKYLEKCVLSILNQTYENLEILLINDGSTDNSGIVCDMLSKRDSRIKVIHKENSGLSATRNLGIKMSTGEYLAFIDSDDYISEDFCEILYNMITENNCEVASVDLGMVREDGYKIVTSDDVKNVEQKSQLYVYEKKDIIKEVLLRTSFKNYVCTKLYRRSVFESCKFKEGVCYEDILFMYEISKAINKLAYINKECYFYLKRANSITATCSEKNLNDFLDIALYRYKDIKELESIEPKYNIYALLESIISISIKYVIANKVYDTVDRKSEYIFEILMEYISEINNELELIQMLSEAQKVSLSLLAYNKELFYNFLKVRLEMKKNGTFVENTIKKPKICLICDVPNWAYDIIAQNIKKELSYKYNFVIDYYDMSKNPCNLYDVIEKYKDFDLIHFFWRKSLLQIETECFRKKVEGKGISVEDYIKKYRKKISTGVHDFLYLDEQNKKIYKDIFNSYVCNYYVNNKKLYDVYSNIEEYKKPKAIIYDPCDWSNYTPINLKRFNIENRPLVIGWVGNSLRKVDGVDLKGFHEIIKPVVQELKNEGYLIEEHYADRNERWRTPEEMKEYYSEIDVCLCTSIHEGTPLPVLEAMSCGVSVISTDVGVVREVFGKKQREFIIGDRKNGGNDQEIKKILKQKIVELYNNRILLKELSNENQKSIIEYDGGKILKNYENYFSECLKQ